MIVAAVIGALAGALIMALGFLALYQRAEVGQNTPGVGGADSLGFVYGWVPR